MAAPDDRPDRRSTRVIWNTANHAVLAGGNVSGSNDPHRLDGLQVIGVDEQVWRHTRRGAKYVTVIIDLTPIRIPAVQP